MLTCCNLICGCIAVQFALKTDFNAALAFVVAGAVFDFFDGFAARLLGVASPIGKELDSLADVVTFGFAPSAVVYSLLAQAEMPAAIAALEAYVPYLAFVMAAFSALRLAKFNLDERQTSSFLGLPTPANALFWTALAYSFSNALSTSPWTCYALMAGVVLSSWLLVSEVPMFALKFKTFALRPNLLRYGFLALSAALILLLGIGGLAWVIVLYVTLSIATALWQKRVSAPSH